ncbi:MAG: hypothetical protein EA349_16035 [Halomonadaceae bacterium]|nr:MAG: hypothetical protein EA349_16035 [Halomonadaceae bacterium]
MKFRLSPHLLTPALVLALSMAPLGSAVAAEDLDQRLQQQLSPVQAGFVGHEAVTVSERSLQEKYLILDFRLGGDLHHNDRDRVQSSVHVICTTILSNRELLSDLSRDGYSRVAVAFDERSQYDCL